MKAKKNKSKDQAKAIKKKSQDISKSNKIKQKPLSNPFNRMLLMFIGAFLLFYIIWGTPFFQENVSLPISKFYASITAALLNLFGMNISVNGDTVLGQGFAMNIRNGCDGIEGLSIYWIAVLLFPTLWSHKFKGLLWGTFFLVFLNFIRLISLYLIGKFIPGIFDFMHESVWQITFIALSLLCLFYWVGWTKKQSSNNNSNIAVSK